MAPLAIRNVRKSYGPMEVIHGVDIDIDDGAFLVLVGPSGCGKSTLLRMIAGLEDVTRGEILIDGHVVNDEHPKDRDIAMVFQSYALYPHMTVAQNMGFSLRMRDAPSSEIDTKVREAAAILHMEALLDSYPRELSGGQRQRVAMGRAIVRDPKVFLFDEPLSNLDAQLRVRMRAEIRELHQRLGTTVVYVTHDQIEAMTMADRIVVMNQGRVEQIGAPLELYDHPRNLFVAGFLGSPAMNLIAGRAPAAGRFETVSGAALALPPDADVPLERNVILGVRPEHLVLVPEGGTELAVTVVEPTGSEMQVVLRAGDEEIISVTKDRVSLRPGDLARCAIAPGHLHVFDHDTGQRLMRPAG